jgi:hypothetical protein
MATQEAGAWGKAMAFRAAFLVLALLFVVAAVALLVAGIVAALYAWWGTLVGAIFAVFGLCLGAVGLVALAMRGRSGPDLRADRRRASRDFDVFTGLTRAMRSLEDRGRGRPRPEPRRRVVGRTRADDASPLFGSRRRSGDGGRRPQMGALTLLAAAILAAGSSGADGRSES